MNGFTNGEQGLCTPNNIELLSMFTCLEVQWRQLYQNNFSQTCTVIVILKKSSTMEQSGICFSCKDTLWMELKNVKHLTVL